MTFKQIAFKAAARDKVLKGATYLADVVRVTDAPEPKRESDVEAAMAER